MGIRSSNLSEGFSDSQSTDYGIPEDLLIEILSFVPSKDLLCNCLLVCHQWKDLILSHGIWKRKCLREGKIIPPFTHNSIPRNFYRLIYLHNPYGRNLLRNPCGEDGLNHWVIHSNDGNGWQTECPPAGADEVPEEVGSQSCYATSYGECTKYQVINLVKEGISPEIMDDFKPPIGIGEWHAARFDCGSIYKLTVALLNEKKFELKKFEFGPYTESQWTGRAWSKVSYIFSDYPPGVRYIGFEHMGQDTQFWAGHYGSKMTGGYVKFILE